MTKNQRKHFLRIWIGCKLFHEDFGLDECNISIKDVDVLHDEKVKEACKYLKDTPALSTTKEVFDYVISNFK